MQLSSMAHLRLFPFAYEEITVNAGIAQPTEARVNGSDLGIMQFDGGQTSYRVDGGTPTKTVGVLTQDGREESFTQVELTQFRATRVTTLNATLRITYYKRG